VRPPRIAYAAAVRRLWFLLAFSAAAPACAEALPRAEQPLAAQPVKKAELEPPPQHAVVTACRATPSTVYGSEAVAFEVEGPGSTARAELQLLDQQGHTLVWDSVAVPGTWRPADVPSGDFKLQAGSNRVTCMVTVNRELSRASQLDH